jgi:hypothetical protein
MARDPGAGRAGRRAAMSRPPRRDLLDGDRLWIVARSDTPDHHVPADCPADLAIFRADHENPDPEFAHQVTRLPQGLSRVDVRHIRFRGLARSRHRDPQIIPVYIDKRSMGAESSLWRRYRRGRRAPRRSPPPREAARIRPFSAQGGGANPPVLHPGKEARIRLPSTRAPMFPCGRGPNVPSASPPTGR